MTEETRGDRAAYLRTALLAGTGIGMLHALGAHAEEQTAVTGPNREEVYIFGQRDAYKLDASSLPKLAVPLIDAPQSIDTISEQVLQDRAVTDFNEALHNVPGVTIGAG